MIAKRITRVVNVPESELPPHIARLSANELRGMAAQAYPDIWLLQLGADYSYEDLIAAADRREKAAA